MPYIKKPGYGRRAFIAYGLFNLILLFTLAVVTFFLSPFMDRWYVILPVVAGFIISEWIIIAETIGPIVQDWIKQEEYVADEPRKS